MNPNLEVLIFWTKVCAIIAGFCATAFPMLYAFSPWYKTALGRAVMLRSIVFAATVDLTVIFTFWVPSDLRIALVVYSVAFTLIAMSCAYLTLILWLMNYHNHQRKKDSMSDQQPNVPEEIPAEDLPIEVPAPNPIAEAEAPALIFSDATYEFLRQIVTVILPGIGTMYSALAAIWGFGYVSQVVGTLAAVAVFLGLLLNLARRAYNKSDAGVDGVVNITNVDDLTRSMSLQLNATPEELEKKDAVTLKVVNQ